MNITLYGNIDKNGIEIVEREGQKFVRYDVGTTCPKWREDEINELEFKMIIAGGKSEYNAIIGIQRRLEKMGHDPYVQNWDRG